MVLWSFFLVAALDWFTLSSIWLLSHIYLHNLYLYKFYLIAQAELGPYSLDYTSSGRYMALAGRKGHLAIIDVKSMDVIREIQVCRIFHLPKI